MKAYLSGDSIRVQTEHPLDDEQMREMLLPRSPGLMPDGSIAVDLTRPEAMAIRRNNPTSEMGKAIHALVIATISGAYLETL